MCLVLLSSYVSMEIVIVVAALPAGSELLLAHGKVHLEFTHSCLYEGLSIEALKF